jgi:putative endonuclease
MKQPCVYIVVNRRNGTLYVGVTSNLPKRAYEHHDEGLVPGFTTRYGCKMLVWYELHDTMNSAIEREKQIKAGSRKKKLTLIEATNPEWKDLYETLIRAFLPVIASEAKQSRSRKKELDCFVASLLAMTARECGLHSPRYALRTSGLTAISAALPFIRTRPVCRM